jgi:hypothetical protein
MYMEVPAILSANYRPNFTEKAFFRRDLLFPEKAPGKVVNSII